MISSLVRNISQNRGLWGGSALAATAALLGTSQLSVAPQDGPLTPDEWRALSLVHKEQLTHGERPTHLLRFALPPNQPDMPVASCLLARLPVGEVKEDGSRKFVIQPYTPISSPRDKHLDLALKVYGDGKLTPHLAAMKVGDLLEFKGPIKKIPLSEVSSKKGIGMIAGGTGITPMLQIASELLHSGAKMPISLIYCNVSPYDIMLKDKLDDMASKHKNFSVYYVVDKGDKDWKGGVGYVTAEMLKEHLPGPSNEHIVLVCGPPGMMKAMSGEKVSPKEQGPLSGLLKSPLGYTEQQVYKF